MTCSVPCKRSLKGYSIELKMVYCFRENFRTKCKNAEYSDVALNVNLRTIGTDLLD